ncbi:site-specific integrase [Micromonospora sp. URMC 103]|uniref:site-specific integrase n=1 Tax=Micromonospora sp. URMC 103 TaxID=3423406 RepID=UPI003F1D097B
MSKRRRAQGEGTIFQLPNGKWRAELDLGWVDGKRRRKTATRSTHRECAQWLTEAKRAKEAGGLVSRTPTVAEWFDTYLSEVAAGRVRSSTLSNYRRDFERHIRPGLGRHRLDALRPEHISRFYATKLHAGLSAYSLRYLHAQIRRALAVAVTWGLVARNVAVSVQPPSLPHKEVSPLTVEEARQLLAAARGDRMEARWIIGLSLGLRQSEVLGLWWEDIDLDAATLRVRRQLTRARVAGEKMSFGPLKSARSMRVLPLPAPLVAALREHQQRQRQERNALGETWADPRLVFTSTIGSPVDHRNDTRAFKALLIAANVRCEEVAAPDGSARLVPKVRLHDLRHTAATLLLAQGVPARVLMELLGHSQIGITMNIYSHVMPTQLVQAADAMKNVLWDEGQ